MTFYELYATLVRKGRLIQIYQKMEICLPYFLVFLHLGDVYRLRLDSPLTYINICKSVYNNCMYVGNMLTFRAFMFGF